MNIDVKELTKGETEEQVNLKAGYEWILKEMSYEDFRKFAQLHFVEDKCCLDYVGMTILKHFGLEPDRDEHYFNYVYMVDKKHDTRKTREEYIKYLLYKLIQNLATPGVRLRG